MALEVPGALVSCVRETAFLQYRAAIEALLHALDAGGSRTELRRTRRRVEQLDALLDQLGWPGEPVPSAAAVSAPRQVLRDALYGALIDAGERLALAAEASWRGEASADSVRVAAREVIGLDRLLRELKERR